MIFYLALSVFFCMCTMSGVWFIYRWTEKASWVDVAWSFLFGVLALVYFLGLSPQGIRHFLMATMAIFWSFRLTFHLFFRVLRSTEDGRYLALQERWGKSAPLKFFLFYQFQGIFNGLLAFPFLLVSLDPRLEVHLLEGLAFLLWMIALLGESLADRQLKQFKRSPENQGRVCQQGLWRYSRHPNYFFEFLIWCSFALFAFKALSPWGQLSFLLPALMLYLLLNVTGIPETEKQSLRSKGEAYREYQERTSAFIPWFPQKKKELDP
jgi:steroid 5-alpha reductase family enzyme